MILNNNYPPNRYSLVIDKFNTILMLRLELVSLIAAAFCFPPPHSLATALMSPLSPLLPLALEVGPLKTLLKNEVK